MSQHNYNIANQSYPATRAAINAVLAAIVSNNSGATAPTTTFPHMFWYDTANAILKQRNAADTGWIDLGYYDQTNSKFVARTFETISKTATYTTVATDRNKAILCNATSAAININLLAAATAGVGFIQTIKKIDSSANTVTVDPNGSETADGQPTIVLSSQYDYVTLISDGTNWHKIASSYSGLSAATTATTQAGLSTTQAVTPGGLKGAIGFSNYYESSELTYVAGFSAYSATHGLANPRFSQCVLRNKITEANFSAGDETNLNSADNASTFSWISGHNATTVFAAGGPVRFGNKTTNTAPTTLTAPSWRVVLRIWG